MMGRTSSRVSNASRGPTNSAGLGIRSGAEGSMTWMFEVCYLPPSDPTREQRVATIVARHGGRLDFREAPEVDGSRNVVLTYEFSDEADAKIAVEELRAIGEYVDGPYQYT